MVFLDHGLELLEEGLALVEPAGRQVGGQAADGDVAVGEPGAAGLLEEVEDLFTLAKRIQKGAERAEVETVGAHAHEVAGDAVELGDQHPQVASLLADLVLHQFLDGKRPAEIHVHRGQVVHPVGVRNPLTGREVFADLLRTAVQVADVGLHLRHDLAVGAEHQPQHAVGARVLRPHVDEHFVGANVEFDDPRIVVDELSHGMVLVVRAVHRPRMPW